MISSVNKFANGVFLSLICICLCSCKQSNSVRIKTEEAPSVKEYHFFQSDLAHIVGQSDGTLHTAEEITDSAGILSYGPYISLGAGDYIVSYQVSSEALSDVKVGWWDIVYGPNALQLFKEDLYGTGGEKIELNTNFSIDEQVEGVQVRIFYGGIDRLSAGDLKLYGPASGREVVDEVNATGGEQN